MTGSMTGAASGAGSGSGLRFQKYVATGNDFLFIDARQALPPSFASLERSKITRALCDRHLGVGADGLVFVEAANGSRFKWDFYNSDGSMAEMCGNASRCMGRWAERVTGAKVCEFETRAGAVRTEVSGDDIVSQLSYLKVQFGELEAAGRKAVFVNTGVPHAVLEVERIEYAKDLRDVIQAFRFHPNAGASGTNVTFLTRLAEARFHTVTFERGVEDFTLSCGTGVLAAAAVGLKASGSAGPAELITPGGTLHAGFGAGFQGATLTGPARYLFAAQVNEEFFK